MGGGSKQTQTSQTTTNTGPWAPQQGYILQAFEGARQSLDRALNAPTYQGDIVAGQNPAETEAYNNAARLGSFASNGVFGNLFSNGGMGSNLGFNTAAGAAGGLGGTIAGNTMGKTINDANQYAAGMDIPSLVKAATADSYENAANNTLPNLYRQAAGTNNLNSDRTALAQGQVEQGLAKNAQNIDAQLRANAYNTGAGLSSNMTGQNLGALAALGQLGSGLFGQGNNAYSQAAYTLPVTTGVQEQAGQGLTAGDQAKLTNDLQKYLFSQASPFEALNNFYNIVGNRSWGEQGTSTGINQTKSSPSTLSSIGSGIGALGSLFAAPAGGVSAFGGLGSFFGGLKSMFG
jgi:hypothetical protein